MANAVRKIKCKHSKNIFMIFFYFFFVFLAKYIDLCTFQNSISLRAVKASLITEESITIGGKQISTTDNSFPLQTTHR